MQRIRQSAGDAGVSESQTPRFGKHAHGENAPENARHLGYEALG